MRNSSLWPVLAGIMILIDVYVFQIVRMLAQSAGPKTKSVIFLTYWIISILAIILLFIIPYLHLENYSKSVRSTVFAVIVGLFLAKLIASVFFLIDDIRRGIQWLVGKAFFRNTEVEQIHEGNRITRSIFLSWLGIGVGGTLFASLIYGFRNRYNYRIKRIPLSFANLPKGFKGIRIVQLSDIHSGSLTNLDAVNKGIDKVLALKPDLILFTGDLVNNEATEMKDFMDVFNRLQAPMGVYSVLGNHDYGDYSSWPSPQAKIDNLNRLKAIHAELGWKLMINENVMLERNGDRIALLGIENWSAKARFPKYGDMKKTYEGSQTAPFKILMSHDPSHWDAEVRPNYSDVDLMLSGHTHGMQFGVEIPGFRWSPVQYVYPQWAGLYENQNQKLYVNRGFGFIGYPGRVGILPEITVLELT